MVFLVSHPRPVPSTWSPHQPTSGTPTSRHLALVPCADGTYEVVGFDLRTPAGRARRPEDPGTGGHSPPYRSGADAGRPVRKRRLPRRQGLPGQDGGSDTPARSHARGRRGAGRGPVRRGGGRGQGLVALRGGRRSRAVPRRLHRGAGRRGAGDLPGIAPRPGSHGQEGRGDRDIRRPERHSSKSRSSPSAISPAWRRAAAGFAATRALASTAPVQLPKRQQRPWDTAYVSGCPG